MGISELIAIIDYGAGNIGSVVNALRFLGQEVTCTNDYRSILEADHVVLPGVGSFGYAMDSLGESGLIPAIREVIEKDTPFLGICLGYQMLFSGSEEDGGCEGLGIFPGSVRRFPEEKGFTVPQIGWNSLNLYKDTGVFSDLPKESYFYFVHSYYVKSEDRDIVSSTTDYIIEYDSSVMKGNLLGCQFHPEKSSYRGLKILERFCHAH